MNKLYPGKPEGVNMNRKQRTQNRESARRLKPPELCPECGEAGPHFVAPNIGFPDGFWTCRKFYDAEGKRKE